MSDLITIRATDPSGAYKDHTVEVTTATNPALIAGEYWELPDTYPLKSPYGGLYNIWGTGGNGAPDLNLVDIHYIGGKWKDIEPTNGNINWGYFESDSYANRYNLNQITAAGKKAIIWVNMLDYDGTHSAPDWVLNASPTPTIIYDGPNNTGNIWGPALWKGTDTSGPRYYVKRFIEAVGNRYKDNPNVACAYITMFNAGGEFNIPATAMTNCRNYGGLDDATLYSYTKMIVDAWSSTFGVRKSLLENSVGFAADTGGADQCCEYALNTGPLGLSSGTGLRWGNGEWIMNSTAPRGRTGESTVTVNGLRHLTATPLSQKGKAGWDFYLDECENDDIMGPTCLITATDATTARYAHYKLCVTGLLRRHINYALFPAPLNTRLFDTQYPAYATLRNYYRRTAGYAASLSPDALAVLQEYHDNSSGAYHNHERYLIQRDVAGTGVTVLGDAITYTPYKGSTGPIVLSRSRRTNRIGGSNYIYFQLDAEFAAADERQFQICVYYKDTGTAQWRVEYNSITAIDTPTFSVTNGNTGVWRTAVFTVSDAYFRRALPSSMDFRIYNGGVSDVTVGMVRVIRTTPRTVQPSDAELRAAGFMLATDFANVDRTGQQDSTDGLQKALTDSFNAYKSLYIPAGTYKVNKTLRLFHWNNVVRNELRTYFVQGCTTSPPTIKLVAGASGFGNAADPMPVICVRAFDKTTNDIATSPFDAQPTHPFDNPSGFTDASGMVVATRIHSVNVDTSGNVGAIGLTWGIAQRGNAAQIKITATNGTAHSFAGLGGPGGTHGISNLEVVGGQYGIYVPSIKKADFQSGAYNSGIKLTGQTVANIALGDFTPNVYTGCYFEMPPNGSVIKQIATSPSQGTRNCNTVFVDCVVKATTDTVAFPANNNTIYLRDVYVTGTTKLVQATSTSTIRTGSGTWSRIDEYSYGGGPCVGNVDGTLYPHQHEVKVDGVVITEGAKNLPHRTLINGTFSGTLQDEKYTITPSVAAPVSLTTYVEKHSHPLLPCIDNGAYCNVLDFGAQRYEFGAYRGGDMVYEGYAPTVKYGNYPGPDNRPVDTQPHIQAAIAEAKRLGHNRVFLPRGVYYISRSIQLGEHTQLFGLGAEKSVIAAMWDWLPNTSTDPARYMIQSADAVNGTASMNDFEIMIRKKFGTPYNEPSGMVDPDTGQPCKMYPTDFFCEVLWRTGRKSWTHGVQTRTAFVNEYYPTQNRQKWTFTNNGGGRHWHLYTDGRLNCASGFRLVLAINTTQPLALYALNSEAGKGVEKDRGYDVQANIELRGASNVRVYGSKREGNGATIWVNGGSNIACYGPGVQKLYPFASGNPYGDSDAAYLAITGNAEGVLIAVSTVSFAQYAANAKRLMLKEIYGGVAKRVYYPEGVALYKRGTINDLLMDFT